MLAGIPRLYDELAQQHLLSMREMLFYAGPRQVGKTTTARYILNGVQENYYSWDVPEQRLSLLEGGQFVAQALGIRPTSGPTRVVFDELHKWPIWKDFLKGWYDGTPAARTLVTGSAHLNAFHSAGDSLMGRYLVYQYHPLSVAELLRPHPNNEGPLLQPPSPLSEQQWQSLWHSGGFPAPFLRDSERFTRQWRHLRKTQLLDEDLRDLTRIHELRLLGVLAELLTQQSGGLISKASLASKIGVSAPTISSWMSTLEAVYYLFAVPPWTANVSRSLLKEPKRYLWDWASVEDHGQRFENFLACALLKAVQFWTDHGLGQFGLHFVRDRDGREVDFLITRDQAPWLLVEAKLKRQPPTSSLHHFSQILQPAYSVQVDFEGPYEPTGIIETTSPQCVSARTFLSQLV